MIPASRTADLIFFQSRFIALKKRHGEQWNVFFSEVVDRFQGSRYLDSYSCSMRYFSLYGEVEYRNYFN